MTEEIDYSILTRKEIIKHKEIQNIKMLKEKFTEDDFLACNKTRVILEEEHMSSFELNCVPKITDLYNYYRENMQGLCATPLYYDVHNEFTSHLKAIVYKNIVKKYDLNIFYNNTNLAKPLIAKLNADVVQTKRKTAKFDVSKTFDWGANINKKNS
jgi:hypothetical protein